MEPTHATPERLSARRHTNLACSAGEHPQPSLPLHGGLCKLETTRVMEPQRFRQISTEIRDNLGIVLTLQEFFRIDELNIPARLRERSQATDQKLDALFGELCDIVDVATQLGEGVRNDAMQMLIARLGRVYDELFRIDQEESDLLFEPFWQNIGVLQ